MRIVILLLLVGLAACGGGGGSSAPEPNPPQSPPPPPPPPPVTTIGDLAEYKFVGENPNDYLGYWVSSAGDVDGDGLDDLLAGAYDDDGSSPGAAYLILGKDLAANGTFNIATAAYKFVGEDDGDWAGFVVSGANLDGDGLSDILIGAYGDADKGPITGAAYVVLASSLGANAVVDLANADYKFIGEDQDDYAGYALSGAADVDGDGLDDILIGASGHDAGGNNAGAGYLILASSLGANKSIDLSQADYKFVGETEQDWAGYQITTAGDVDGDGLDDLILGSDGDDGGTQAHASYLFLGSTLGTDTVIDLSQADYKFLGENSYDYASQVSTAGDVDGDGLDDIIIGAAGHDDAGDLAGAAYIVRGSSLGADAVIDLSTADYKFTGENPGDYAGATVADAGDVDGDGLGDILVGALNYSTTYTDQGAAYIVLGKSLGSNRNISLKQADQKLIGEFTEQFAGVSVASAGDVNGDGLDDIVLGAYDGPDWKGAAYIVISD